MNRIGEGGSWTLVEARMARVPRFADRIAILCPFHAERTPSCVFSWVGADFSWLCLGCNREGVAYQEGEYANRDMQVRMEWWSANEPT